MAQLMIGETANGKKKALRVGDDGNLTVSSAASGTDPSGSAASLPWKMTITNNTAQVFGMNGIAPERTVWKTAGDTIRVRYRVDPDANWVTLVEDAADWSDTLLGPISDYEFQRTAGTASTSKVGVR